MTNINQIKTGQRVRISDSNIICYVLDVNEYDQTVLCEYRSAIGIEIATFAIDKISIIDAEQNRSMIIAVDFDGTCTTHDFPRIGTSIGAESVLRELANAGHRLILWTLRSNKAEVDKTSEPDILPIAGRFLDDAVQWFVDNDIPLWSINQNPEQSAWTDSPKAYAQLLIDDTALGCPVKFDETLSDRPFVDWNEVRQQLVNRQILLPYAN